MDLAISIIDDLPYTALNVSKEEFIQLSKENYNKKIQEKFKEIIQPFLSEFLPEKWEEFVDKKLKLSAFLYYIYSYIINLEDIDKKYCFLEILNKVNDNNKLLLQDFILIFNRQDIKVISLFKDDVLFIALFLSLCNQYHLIFHFPEFIEQRNLNSYFYGKFQNMNDLFLFFTIVPHAFSSNLLLKMASKEPKDEFIEILEKYKQYIVAQENEFVIWKLTEEQRKMFIKILEKTKFQEMFNKNNFLSKLLSVNDFDTMYSCFCLYFIPKNQYFFQIKSSNTIVNAMNDMMFKKIKMHRYFFKEQCKSLINLNTNVNILNKNSSDTIKAELKKQIVYELSSSVSLLNEYFKK